MASLTGMELTLHSDLCSAVLWTGVGTTEQRFSLGRTVPAQCHSVSAPHSDTTVGTSRVAKQPEQVQPHQLNFPDQRHIPLQQYHTQP